MREPKQPEDRLPIIARIERALVLLAYIIELDGDVHIPMYEKFESELEELRQRQSTRERARKRLSTYYNSVPLTALPLKVSAAELAAEPRD